VATLRRLLSGAIAATAVVLGCYNPNISPGGFSCGVGGACPDKFQCNLADNKCYQGKVDAQVPVDMPPACTSVTSITTPICGTEPTSGQQCNPTCQTGCNGCGWCTLVGGKAMCVTGTEGSTGVGDPCDPTKQYQCKAGLYCQPECGSVTTGRCYQFCDATNKVCGSGGSTCSITARAPGADAGFLPFTLCSLVSTTCDVIAQTGCPGSFACYPSTGTVNVCDCPGAGNPGASCVPSHDCAPGNYCVRPSVSASGSCQQACKVQSDCTLGGTCNYTMGFVPGFCM
jgi:hypothetical protein